jgi:predicted amidohydrolase YtcJ
MLKNIFILTVAISFLFSCHQKKIQVDQLFYNGIVYSVDSSFTVYEAFVVKDGKILALNSDKELFKKYEAKVITNLNGKTVVPGFIDAHCHFLGYGLGLQQVNLVGTTSFNDVLKRVSEFVNSKPADKVNMPSILNKGDWIIGRGWDQNDWKDKQFPDNKKLDSLFPKTPVILYRIDGHAALVNTQALKRAGITQNTKLTGGELLIKNNKLTGILIDNAVDLVKKIIPKNNDYKIKAALLSAQLNCLAMGLTTIDDAGLMKSEIDVIDSLHKSGKLKLRVYAMLSDSASNYEYYLKNGPYKTEWLNVRSFKFYADGALGSRGACLSHDYNDKKNWKGFLLSEKRHFEEYAKIIIKKGFQMNTHCIGDSAYKIILQTYKNAGASKNNRWRIEHAQVVNPDQMKLSDYIIPSVQPTHATSDMYWAQDRLGEGRLKHAYAYKQLLKVCGVVALGTDFPVEDISPFKTFYAAVARQDNKGYPEKGFQIENALSREETLRGMTIWAAYSNFEENEKGSLENGKYADFVVLDKNIMSCKIEDVLNTRVLFTYINGEKVYENVE